MSQGALEKLNPQSRSLAVTGESKVPFSQGIVPRKATTMPKPQWHSPWKLMRVCFHYLCVCHFYLYFSLLGSYSVCLLFVCKAVQRELEKWNVIKMEKKPLGKFRFFPCSLDHGTSLCYRNLKLIFHFRKNKISRECFTIHFYLSSRTLEIGFIA